MRTLITVIVIACAACAGNGTPDPVGTTQQGSVVLPDPTTPPVSCGDITCAAGEYCCYADTPGCANCAPFGSVCPICQQPCSDRVCGAGEYCCNPSCGICAPYPDGVCIDMICATPNL